MSEWKEWTGKKLPKRNEHIVVMDGITEEQVRIAVDDEIVRRLKESDEDHGE